MSEFQPPLTDDIECDDLIVGGGMAGLHAALELADRGHDVVLLERNICGGSSTGKSAGFLTPDSELELSQLLRRFGKTGAATLWSVASQGVDRIVQTIRDYELDCDFQEQDSLYVGIGKSGAEAVKEEAEAREALGFSSTVYNETELKKVNKGKDYTAGIRYTGTYGINPLLYAQELKTVLIKKGVRVYESTEVTQINGHKAKTHLGSVTAENIIICIDKMKPGFSPVSKETYHAQTFLSITEPLPEHDIRSIIPERDVQCWDSTLVYTYYRLTGDNRLLLGGGSALTTFSPMDVNSPHVIQSVHEDFRKRFPCMNHVDFIQFWPGRIDTTKDLIPIVDFDPENPHIQYVLGCVGLPWAAFCGYYAARRLEDKKFCHSYCHYLRIDRDYLLPNWFQKLTGKMFTFSMHNAYSKYVQKEPAKPTGDPNLH